MLCTSKWHSAIKLCPSEQYACCYSDTHTELPCGRVPAGCVYCGRTCKLKSGPRWRPGISLHVACCDLGNLEHDRRHQYTWQLMHCDVAYKTLCSPPAVGEVEVAGVVDKRIPTRGIGLGVIPRCLAHAHVCSSLSLFLFLFLFPCLFLFLFLCPRR